MISVVGIACMMLAGLAAMGLPAQADIYAPTYADATNNYNRHPACNLMAVGDSNATEWTVNTGDVSTWLHATNNSAWGMYQANNTTTPSIWVCLPDPVAISSVYLWNGYQDNTAGDCKLRGVQDFTVATSTGRNNTGFTQQGGTYSFGDDKGVTTYSGSPVTYTKSITFNQPVTGHYVRIDVLNTYGGAYTTLSAVRFDAVKLASNIITPVSAAQSSYKSTSIASGYCSGKRLFDGGLMNEPGVDLSQWTLEATSHAIGSDNDENPSAWVSASGVGNQWVRFDLGSAQNLGKIHLWNLNVDGQTALGVRNMEVWKTDSAGNNIALLATITDLPQATGTSAYADQAFSLSGATDVQYVKLCNFTNWGGSSVGLSEVRFEKIPEPGTLALLAAGLVGLLAYAWRKRK
jgi:hypothetical protein